MVGSPPSSRASPMPERTRKSSVVSKRSSGMNAAAGLLDSIESTAKQNEQARLHVAVSEMFATSGLLEESARHPVVNRRAHERIRGRRVERRDVGHHRHRLVERVTAAEQIPDRRLRIIER